MIAYSRNKGIMRVAPILLCSSYKRYREIILMLRYVIAFSLTLFLINPAFGRTLEDQIKVLQEDLSSSLQTQKSLQSTISELQKKFEENIEEKAENLKRLGELQAELAQISSRIKYNEVQLADLRKQIIQMDYDSKVEAASTIFSTEPVGGNAGGENTYATPDFDTIMANRKDPNYRCSRIGLWIEERWFRGIYCNPADGWEPPFVHEHYPPQKRSIRIPFSDGYKDIESAYVIIDIPSDYRLVEIYIEHGSWIDLMRFAFKSPGKPLLYQSYGRRKSGKDSSTISKDGQTEILALYGIMGKFCASIGGRYRTTDWPVKPEELQ